MFCLDLQMKPKWKVSPHSASFYTGQVKGKWQNRPGVLSPPSSIHGLATLTDVKQVPSEPGTLAG